MLRKFQSAILRRSTLEKIRSALAGRTWHLRAMEEIARADIVLRGCLRRTPTNLPGMRIKPKCQREDCGCERRLAEKMTDVNIALRLFEDAIDGLSDRAYLVSADVDQNPGHRCRHAQSLEAQVVVFTATRDRNGR